MVCIVDHISIRMAEIQSTRGSHAVRGVHPVHRRFGESIRHIVSLRFVLSCVSLRFLSSVRFVRAFRGFFLNIAVKQWHESIN